MPKQSSSLSDPMRALLNGLVFSLGFGGIPGAFAATWINGGNNSWNNNLNWSPAAVPNGTDAVAIFNSATASLNGKAISLATPVTLGELIFGGNATPSSYSFTGSPFSFEAGTGLARISYSDANNVTISSGISLLSDLEIIAATSSYTGANSLVLSGAFAAGGHNVRTVMSNAASTLTFSGNLTGSGTNFMKSGAGTLIFSGANKTFDGGLDVTAGKAETTLANAADASLVIGQSDATRNYLGRGNISVSDAGTLLNIKSALGNYTNQNVALNGGTVSLINGGEWRLTEQDVRNAFALQLNSGTLDGGTFSNAGILRLVSTDLVYNASGAGGISILHAPTLIFDASANTTAMKVTLNNGTLNGFGLIRKTGANALNFIDSGTFGAQEFRLEAGTTGFGTATLDLAAGLTFADTIAQTSLLTPTGVATFGKTNQMAAGGNHLNGAAGATGSLMLGGFDQTFGTITLGIGSRLNLHMQPASATPMNLTIGSLASGADRLSIHGWRGNPNTHVSDGTATITDQVTVGAGNLANVWFRGFDPGAVVGTDGVLRPVDFLHTAWTVANTGTRNWFDLANWAVDVPDHAGAVATFGTLAANTTISLGSRTVTIGHLVLNTAGRPVIGTGTLAFNSGVTGTASTISGPGYATINTVNLQNDLTINAGAASNFTNLTGTGDLTINSGGLTINTGTNSGYTGTITLNGGRLTVGNESLGAATNTLRINGGEVYGGTNTTNVRTISNKLEWNGDFTASYIDFNYAGDLSWTSTRTITGEGYVTFDEPLRLTGSGELIVKGGSGNGDFFFKNNNNDFSGGLTVRPRNGYGTGGAHVSLLGDMALGADVLNQNYLGSGDIHAYAGINVTTNGHDTTMFGNVILDNAVASTTAGAKMTFTGGGKLTLDSTATLTKSGAGNSQGVVMDGDLAINGATLVNRPNFTFNPGTGETRTITSTSAGGIPGMGTVTKNQDGVTILDTKLQASSYAINGGVFVLNRDGAILDNSGIRPSLAMTAGTLQSAGGTAAAPVTNNFGTLSITGNVSMFLDNHSAITFNSGSWATGLGYSLNLQNSTGTWSTAAQPTLSDTYVRFTSASGLSSARLVEVAFTGYEAGAALVKQTIGGIDYWFLAPTGDSLIEWRGAADTGIDTNRRWGTATNWVGNIVPNGATKVAAVRDLDGLLDNNTIIVDGAYAIGKLLIESNAAQHFNLASQSGGTLTFDNGGAGAMIAVSGDNTTEISADLILQSDDMLALKHIGKQVLTLSGKVSGNGGIVSDYAGVGTAAQQSAGIIRFAGNAGTSDYTGGFWAKGATGNNPALDHAARKLIIATDGSIFGTGTVGIDAASSTQSLQLGEGAASWYRLDTEGGARTIDGTLRLNGNLMIDSADGLTFQSTNTSYITAGLKQISGNGGKLTFRTPIDGPGGLQFGGANTTVNFYNTNTFSGGILFLNAYSPVMGIGADNALGTGTITYDNINVGNSPFINALDGPRTLSNQFVFQSPVGASKSTAKFTGEITLNHNGHSQLNITPGINVNGSASTLVFANTHILEGNGGLIKNGDGTLRLEAANEYLGGTELVLGTLQAGNNLAFSTGTLTLSGGKLASYGGARTLGNDIVFNATNIGLDGTAGLLTLNPATTGDTALSMAHNFAVTGNVAFGNSLRLTGTGSLAKSGAGTLILNNANADYTGGSTVSQGTLRVNATGDVTLGRIEAGQNHLGAGSVAVTSTAAGSATLEILTANGANIHLGGNLALSGNSAINTASLNITDTAGSVSGSNITTYLDATQTISGNANSYLRTPGNLVKTGTGTTTTIAGGNIITPNLVLDSGTLRLTANNQVAGISQLTIGNGTLATGGTTQNFGATSVLNLTGTGGIDMGNAGAITFGTVGAWNVAGALNVSNWTGNSTAGNGVSQFRFVQNVTPLFSSAMLSSVIFSGGGINYSPGAKIVLNASGFYELLPLGTSSVWVHNAAGHNWGTGANWQSGISPNGVGASATFANNDAALNGQIITVDTGVTLGSLVLANTAGAHYTITGSPITFEQTDPDERAVISVSGDNAVTLASRLDLNNDLLVAHYGTGTLTVSGQITGAGKALIKDGNGTLALTGSNTYSGGTQLVGGIILAGADSNFGAAGSALTFDGGTLKLANAFDLDPTRPITLASGGGTIDTNGYNTTAAQAITGAGGLTKEGAGTLTLTGNNAYTGITTISVGTLQIGNGGTTGSIVGDIANSGSLIFNRSDDTAYAGVVSGTGSLEKLGAGTLTITSANTYTGGTTISAGTLQIGDGGTTGSITGNVANNGTLSFNHSDNIGYAGVISGSGSLEKQGAGDLTLTGTNTYGSGTAVQAGKLIVTHEQNIGTSSVNIASGATLQVAPTAGGPFTFNNALSNLGTGTLQVDLQNSTDSFAFGSGAVPGFSGTVLLNNSAFNLTGSNTTALTNATLQLNTGNTTTVGSGTQAIGNLAIDNGTLVFDANLPNPPTGTITTDNVHFAGGKVQVSLAQNYNPTLPGAVPLLQQDDNVILHLVDSNTTSGNVSLLTLIDMAGTPVAANQQQGIYDAGNTLVATGSYGYGLTAIDSHTGGNGLFVEYSLQQIDIHAGKTLALTSDTAMPALGNELHAQITGTGNLVIDATDSITLNNGANDYTGATTVQNGTLMLGANHALGNTADLILNAGATADINGKTQTVGALHTAAGSTLDLHTGTLGIANGGLSAGTLTGAGALKLDGGLFIATGDSSSLAATTTVGPAATFGGSGQYGSASSQVINHGALIAANVLSAGPATNWTLGGDLANYGRIVLAGSAIGNTLTVNGNYSSGSQLEINTILGEDDSPTDKLIIHGNTSGLTHVRVNNLGGAGGQTTNGIRIVEVDGQSAGVFVREGTRLIAGAYEYDLYKGGIGASAQDGHWYLRPLGVSGPNSTPSPRPEPYLYVRNTAAASTMFIHTLHDRLGEPQYTDAYQSTTETSKSGNVPAGWVRVVANHADSESAGGRIGLDTDTTLIHLGGDIARWNDSGNNRYHVGIMGAYGKADTKASSKDVLFTNNGLRRKASGEVEGYSVGAYGTWFGNDKSPEGPYADIWAFYGWYGNNTVKGSGLPKETYDSKGWTVSVEGGYALIARETENRQWIFEPQVQLAYTNFMAENHRETNGTWIDDSDANGFTTRLGARIYSRSKQGDNGIQPFAEGNIWYSDAKNSLEFNGRKISDGTPNTRYELKLGAQGEIKRNWQLWGHVGMQWGEANYGRHEAMIGTKYMF